ncbi:MAG: alpha-galactosidase [Lachnospiraceae bacterium]|nr:alpha-galactosidase [Lachnospiraceae bacterium]MBO4696110.1 alpha-galactosidase [Lachnospiraceae bacterium]
MEFYAEWRLRGDRYDNGYGNGMTLSNGESVQEMTKVSENEKETVFRGKNGHVLTCLRKKQGDVTVCRTVFRNETDRPAVLEMLASFALKGIKADRMHRATSFWSAEGKLLSQSFTELNMEESWAGHGYRVEHFGQTGSLPVRKWFPFLVLEDSEAGHFLGIQLYCAGSWQMEVLHGYGDIRVLGGLADRDFGAWTKTIAPGESFETPRALIAEGSSLEEVCDRLVKAQKPRIAEADRDMPVIFNEYCSTWGNPSEDLIEKMAARLKGSGVKYFVIDCGWYRQRDGENWFNSAGDWKVSPILFPSGLKKTCDTIRANGLIPGIWFEMEDCGVDSETYSETDLLVKRDGIPVTVGTRRFLDMRKKEVWERLDRRVLGLHKDNGFGYLKVDYNETIGVGVDALSGAAYDGADITICPEDGPGEGLRQCIEGTQAYFRHLAAEMPELVIENCASGGHRLEPSMMELVSQASFSDAHECTIIPLVAANLHRLIRPEQSQIWAVIREDSDIDRIYYLITSALLGRLCLSGEIFALPEERWNAVTEGVAFYGEVKEIIRSGFTKLIRTTVEDYKNPAGYQAVLRTYGDEALLIVHTLEKGANPPIGDILNGYDVIKAYGSELDADFRGKAFLLRKK